LLISLRVASMRDSSTRAPAWRKSRQSLGSARASCGALCRRNLACRQLN
jgi:hypothetical protein